MAHHLDLPGVSALASFVSFFVPPTVYGGTSYITNSWTGDERRKRLIRFIVTVAILLAVIVYFDAKLAIFCSYWSLFAYILCFIATDKSKA